MKDLAVIGMGQLGQLFSAGALRAGFRVTAVLRSHDLSGRLADLPLDAPVLVSVGEADLPEVLARLDAERVASAMLVQNGLTRARLDELAASSATLANVWTNKKPGQPLIVGRPTALFGTNAETFAAIHAGVGIPSEMARTELEIDTDIVGKYAFILTINALGHRRGGTVGDLLDSCPDEVDVWLSAAVNLGAARAKVSVDESEAMRRAKEAMSSMRSMPAAGRSAERRLNAAIMEASELGVALP